MVVEQQNCDGGHTQLDYGVPECFASQEEETKGAVAGEQQAKTT